MIIDRLRHAKQFYVLGIEVRKEVVKILMETVGIPATFHD